jgi:putative ABC transport system ATP-binding protein
MTQAQLGTQPTASDGAATEFVVRVRDVVKEYQMGKLTVRALDGVTLDIYRGEYLSIMGPSGSGKSTLFNMIGGLDKPTAGSVFIDDVDMAQLDPQELAFLRCHRIGYIFQTFNLIPVMTALENVTLPMVFAGGKRRRGARARGGTADSRRAGRTPAPQADRTVGRTAAARRHRTRTRQ